MRHKYLPDELLCTVIVTIAKLRSQRIVLGYPIRDEAQLHRAGYQ
jgi:hypothetical protein